MTSFFCIIAPLYRAKKFSLTSKDITIVVYFALIGLGYIFIEMSIVQQFTLFLGNPVYSFSVILASLLVATGVGSLLSKNYFDSGRLTVFKTALMICIALITYYIFLSKTIKMFLSAPLAGRLFLTFLFIFPLGIMLGALFPHGLRRLHQYRPQLIPWAWAVNGYMSIVGSLISVYLSLAVGTKIYFLIAAFLYIVVGFLKIDIFEEGLET
jgi:predicted membrane-bound spermidine synthase